MARSTQGRQLRLPLAEPSRESLIAEAPAGAPVPWRTNRVVSDLTNAELLTLLVGTAHATRCEQLVATCPTFRHLVAANLMILIDHGFTAAAVTRLEAVLEIVKRYGETPWPEGEPFRGSADVYGHFRERLAAETCEQFYAVLLDQKHRKIRDVVLSKGSLTASVVHPRDVYGQVIRHAAAAVIFVHNHPSGDPTPSTEDIALTRRLREVGDLIGVRVLDHIIVGKGRYVSFVDEGYW